MHRLIARTATEHPDAVAVFFEGQTLSFRQLEARAELIRGQLVARGVTGGRVGILLNPGVDLIPSILGVLKAGAAYVPIDPEYPAERIHYIVGDAELTALITSNLHESVLPSTTPSVLCVEDLPGAGTAAGTGAPAASPSTPDDPAYLIYTSGSTGAPKGVVVSHRNLVSSTWARFDYYEHQPKGFLLLSSSAFDSSVAGIFWALCAGGAVCLTAKSTRLDPAVLGALIRQHGLTHLLAVPSLYRAIAAYSDPADLASLTTVIVAGEVCDVDLIRQHYDRLPDTQLHNEYGPTEATVWCAAHRCLNPPNYDRTPIGRAIANTRLYVVGADNALCSIGARGELYVGGAGVSLGYWKRPDLDAERFVPDPEGKDPTARLYRTGDIVRWLPTGELEFFGREDDQVKVRGHRIELGEIENALRGHPGVQEAACLLRDDGPSPHVLVGYAVLVSEKATSSDDLIRHLRSKLPAYMVPSGVVIVESMPRTPNGKLDRARLPQMQVDQPPAHIERRGEARRGLASLCAEILGSGSVDEDKGFVSLGGDSLLAIQLVMRLRAQGIDVSIGGLLSDVPLSALKSTRPTTRPEPIGHDIRVPALPATTYFLETSNASFVAGVRLPLPFGVGEDLVRDAVETLVRRHGLFQCSLSKEPEGFTLRRLAAKHDRREDYFSSVEMSEHPSTPAQLQAVEETTASRCGLGSARWFHVTHVRAGGEGWLLLAYQFTMLDMTARDLLLSDLESLVAGGSGGEHEDGALSYLGWQAGRTFEQLEPDWNFWNERESRPSPPLWERDGSEGAHHVKAYPVATLRRSATSAEINEGLCAAVAHAIAAVTDCGSLRLLSVANGRFAGSVGYDPSEVVGNVASYFPLHLTLSKADTARDVLSQVHAEHAAMPKAGSTYCLVRQVARREGRLSSGQWPLPEVFCEYVGAQAKPWKESPEKIQPFSQVLELDGRPLHRDLFTPVGCVLSMAKNGELQAEVWAPKSALGEAAFERFLDALSRAGRELFS